MVIFERFCQGNQSLIMYTRATKQFKDFLAARQDCMHWICPSKCDPVTYLGTEWTFLAADRRTLTRQQQENVELQVAK